MSSQAKVYIQIETSEEQQVISRLDFRLKKLKINL